MTRNIIILLFLLISTRLYSQEVKPEDLNLPELKGIPNLSNINRGLSDTVVVDQYTLEDVFLDAVVLHRSTNELVLYRNEANGKFSVFNKIPLTKKGRKIERITPDSKNEGMPNDISVKIFYENNETEIIDKPALNRTKPIDKAPYDVMGYSSKPFVYSFDIVEKWRSDPNGNSVVYIPKGDLDNDGKVEVVYCFYPIPSANYPVHLVIFECYGDNQYVVDWDSTFQNWTYIYSNAVSDFDKNGQKEFFLFCNFWGYPERGLMECKGEGVYKWYYSSFPSGVGQAMDYEVRDSINSEGKSGAYTLDYGSDKTTLRRFVFATKNDQGGWGNFYFHQTMNIIFDGMVYDISVDDIDGDTAQEIMIGSTQWSTNFVEYMDYTGSPVNNGYEYRMIIPNAPVSSGWFIMKDYDGDDKKEIFVSGIGAGTGSVGLFKHTGAPGEQNYQLMWWDSTIYANCNRGNDSVTMENKFCVYHPCITGNGPILQQENNMFYYSGNYSFERFHYSFLDSIWFLLPKYYDVDKDGKMDIITSILVNNSNPPGTNSWFLGNYEQIGTVGISPTSNQLPSDFVLHQNYPNPFNPVTNISFDIPQRSFVSLKIYDITGREITTLINETKTAGRYTVNFNGSGLSSGVYFYRIESEDFVQTKKMLLVK